MNWRSWDYYEWNARLVEHHLGTRRDENDGCVDRISATPAELWEVAGGPEDEPDAIGRHFVELIAHELRGTRFCNFCYSHDAWDSESEHIPDIFGMLWFTCLVAFGFPSGPGGYFDRLHSALGKHEDFYYAPKKQPCLPDLWRSVADWTRRRHAAGDDYRELRLPKETAYRAVIGYSHFLAFPNFHDRQALAGILSSANLLGLEPPIANVLAVLAKNRAAFSPEFNEDLAEFRQAYLRGEDPRDDPFWRVVCQEARHPSAILRCRTGMGRVLIFQNSDEGLLPVVACSHGEAAPRGYRVVAFGEPIEPDSYLEALSAPEPWSEAFAGRLELAPGQMSLLSQGVLVLAEASSWHYSVASGAEIQGCRTAVVREDVLGPFLRAFGGIALPGMVDGWFEVHDCDVRQSEELPEGLAALPQFLKTVSAPPLLLVGGIRVAEGYLLVPGFLPRIRAAGAERLAGTDPFGVPVQFKPAVESGEWDWASEPSSEGPYRIEAVWSVRLPNNAMAQRSTSVSLRLVVTTVQQDFKGAPAGMFLREACPRAEEEVDAAEEVPLGITTKLATRSADLISLDATARYLGPGLGEMSLAPKVGFDWLVVGPKNSPHALIFVGDVANPTLPAERRSTSSGDRTHWRKAISARSLYWKDAGAYRPFDDAPQVVKAAHGAYRRHNPPVACPECDVTSLETVTESPPSRVKTCSATQSLIDALAAISSRRSGVRYTELQALFTRLLQTDNKIVFQQVLRGWCDIGVVDLLRHPTRPRLTVVARPPRFVLVRRGPAIEGTVLGLLHSTTVSRLERAGRPYCSMALVESGCPWLPASYRLTADVSDFERIRQDCGFSASQWLEWPDPTSLPDCLAVQAALDALPHNPPPEGFRGEASWDWDSSGFVRGKPAPTTGVQLERRIHGDLSTIYVVLRDGVPVAWGQLRSWVLLEAYAMRGTPPFKVDAAGHLSSDGRTPVHLPLPIGRLCMLIGVGAPGPVWQSGATPVRYLYPFGRRLWRAVSRIIPGHWIVAN